MKIATDIFRDLGMAAPEMAVDYQGRLYINAVIPSKNKPGETIDPQISLYETKDGLAVWINDNGDGSGALSKKLRDVVERVLSRNNCSAWKLNEHTSSFDFK